MQVWTDEWATGPINVGIHHHPEIKGLRLIVRESTRKGVVIGDRRFFTQRLRLNGNRFDVPLGGLADIDTLGEVEARAYDNLRLVKLGIDPRAEDAHAKALTAKSPKPKRASRVPTFRQVACTKHQAKVEKGGVKKRYLKDWLAVLEKHALPLMDMPVNKINAQDVHDVVNPIWAKHPRAARNLFNNIRQVMGHAKFRKHIKVNPIDDDLLKELGGQNHVVQNHPSVPYEKVSKAGLDIWKSNSGLSTRACLTLMIYTACRSAEAREATWGEIDWDEKIWTIDAERMKRKRTHIIPLSDEAIKLLQHVLIQNYVVRDGILKRLRKRHTYKLGDPKNVHQHIDEVIEMPDLVQVAMSLMGDAKGDLIFTSRKGKPLTDAALSKLCKKLDLPSDQKSKNGTPHGFRATFATWCEESKIDDATSEICLAHAVGSQARQAYKRSKRLEERREIMQQWADYLSQ